MNGQLVKGKVKCADCGEYSKIGGKYPQFASYNYNGRYVCRNCAKAKGVI